jgi:protein-L-isoaspartate(D-aspartate) O-methyltransferase
MGMTPDEYAEQRRRMVEVQLEARGIQDQAVLQAMRNVPREAFVPLEHREAAYEDGPLPIGEGQTISQPYIVACMTEALMLSSGDRVLEIGTGSGYAAAVLGCIAREVYTVERLEVLAERARRCLQRLAYTNVHVVHGNGTLGLPEHAPYDGIVVTAAGPSIPEALRDQLALGGRLVMPVGKEPKWQKLMRVTRKSPTEFQRADLGSVRFVPLIGAQGWPEDSERGKKSHP